MVGRRAGVPGAGGARQPAGGLARAGAAHRPRAPGYAPPRYHGRERGTLGRARARAARRRRRPRRARGRRLEQSLRTALAIARPGGAIGRVGAPQQGAIPDAVSTFFRNVTVGGGSAPARAYIEALLPDVLDGRIEPGRVFDRVIGLDEVPDGYRAMTDREAIKALITCCGAR